MKRLARSFAGTVVVLALETRTSAASDAEPTKRECVAANEAAQDLRRAGKLHESYANLAVCLSQSCPRVVREDCDQRLGEVEAAMPTVDFVMKDRTDRELSDVRVDMDGQPLLDKLDGAAVSIDPGEHRFSFESDGFRTMEAVVLLREGEKHRIVSVVLEPDAPMPTAETRALRAPDTLQLHPAVRAAASGRTGRSVALALGGAGLASLAVGSVLGVMAKSAYDKSLSECPSGVCTLQAYQDHRTAYGQATAATIAFVAAGALLVGGVAFYVTASPAPRGHEAQLGLRARW